jgi:hypothetical protein
MKPTLREQINIMEDRLNKAIDHENWQAKEINSLRNQNTELLKKIDELNRDKNWLKQLCQEQSSSIAGYMRSR